MKWVHVRQLSDVYCVMLIVNKVVKEDGNVEATMHSMSTVIVKACENAMQQTVARTIAVVRVNQVSWSLTPQSRRCFPL